jgi:hypothetical protein
LQTNEEKAEELKKRLKNGRKKVPSHRPCQKLVEPDAAMIPVVLLLLLGFATSRAQAVTEMSKLPA